jgi:hypothetical protein
MGKHFIDPKSSEILSIFKVLPCTTQIALFWPKLLPALFALRSLDIPALLKSWQKHYACCWLHLKDRHDRLFSHVSIDT